MAFCTILFSTPLLAAEPLKDREGKSLPDGAVMRLGTTSLRLASTNQALGSITVSLDGKRVACHEMSRVYVWEVETGKTLRQFDFRFSPARADCLAISADGKQVMAASYDGNIHCWDVETGETIVQRKVTGDTFHWFGLGFRPDGTPLFTQRLDGPNEAVCILFEAKTGRNLHTFRTEDWSPTSVDILPDGKTFMGAYFNVAEGKISTRVFKGDKYQLESSAEIDPKETPRNVALSPDGSTLFIVHQNYKLSFWNSSDGKLLSETEELPTLNRHDVPACISWDGKLAAVSGFIDGTVRLFDTSTGKQTKSFNGALVGGHMAWSKDGKRLFHRSTHRVQIWEVATGKEMHLGFESHRMMPDSIAYRPDGKEVASAVAGEVRFWNPRTGEHLERWAVSTSNHIEAAKNYSLSYSPDGKSVLWVDGQKIVLWDRASGKVLKEWKDLEFPIAQFHLDGKRLLIAPTRNGKLESWDISTGKLLQSIDIKPPHSPFAIAPNGTHLAICSNAGIQILNLDTGKEICFLRTPDEHQYYKPYFDSSSRFVSTLREPDLTWTVFDLTSSMPRHGVAHSGGNHIVSQAHSPRVLAFDDDSISTLDSTNTELKFLDTATGRIRNRKTLPFSSIGTMAFSPDGRYLATGNSDTTILIWDTWNLKGEFAVPDQVTEEMVREQWEHLGVDYVENVDWMIQVMCKKPEVTLSLLSKKLAPVDPVDATKLKNLMNDLDAERFVTRQRATIELTKLGEGAIDELRRRRESTTSEDLRTRIETILNEIDQPLLSGERLRIRRAMEILERIKTPEAKELLQKLAKGDPAAMLTREAKGLLVGR